MHPRVSQVLQASGISYRTHHHADYPGPIRSPHDFAHALGYEVARITKTLFLQGDGTVPYLLVVCSVLSRVEFAHIAPHVGSKRLSLGTVAALAARLGYPPLGVSPLGAEGLPLLMEEGLLAHPTILVGAGSVGVEIELAPADLAALTHATLLPLSF